jgi:glucose-6-phosphate 1-epimerase
VASTRSALVHTGPVADGERDDDPCIPRTATGADGTELSVCRHGGHVLGWTPAGGRPRLWLSPAYECGPGRAIRGGVPVIFPQFAARGPLPKHGFARDRAWRAAAPAPIAGGGLGWTATLSDDPATRAIWPHRFELTLSARAAADTLEIELAVRNLDDPSNPVDSADAGNSVDSADSADAFEFTAALHTYLALGDPAARLLGLGGRTGEDNADGGRPVDLGAPGSPLGATDARDVAVPGAGGPLVLADPAAGELRIEADGFDDRVVWNPGAGHGLGDVPEGAERDFVCVEPAVLTAVRLEPGAVWTGRQRLVAPPPSRA